MLASLICCLLSDNLTSIDSTLARSTKVIKRMARKMATDKSVDEASTPTLLCCSRCARLLSLLDCTLQLTRRSSTVAAVLLRVIWVFAFLVFAAIVFIIIWSKVKPGDKDKFLVPDIPDPINGGGSDTGSG